MTETGSARPAPGRSQAAARPPRGVALRTREAGGRQFTGSGSLTKPIFDSPALEASASVSATAR